MDISEARNVEANVARAITKNTDVLVIEMVLVTQRYAHNTYMPA